MYVACTGNPVFVLNGSKILAALVPGCQNNKDVSPNSKMQPVEEIRDKYELLVHMSEDHPELLVDDDIQFILLCAAEIFPPVHLGDLHGFCHAGIVTINDCVAKKWDLVRGALNDFMCHTRLLVHLFVIWFEKWLNLFGDCRIIWREILRRTECDSVIFKVIGEIYASYLDRNYSSI